MRCGSLLQSLLPYMKKEGSIMPLKLIRNDITRMQVDAVVNTANPEPTYGAGVDVAVYTAAGKEKLLAARRAIGPLEEGNVAITPGFNLPAKHIIHAVSPRYINGASGEEKKLRDCYRKSLLLAKKNNCKSVAFPLISTGSFGYPKEEAMTIAVDEISSFLLWEDMLVYLVVFDKESTALGNRLAPALDAYIDAHYVEEKQKTEYAWGLREESRRQGNTTSFLFAAEPSEKTQKPKRMPEFRHCNMQISAPSHADVCKEEACYSDFLEENQSALKERMRHMSDTFQEYLLYLIEVKGLTNAEVYKRALITKQLFSKIKLNPNYHPDKATAMRLCVGAGLNLDETKDLLARAGYALSPCDKRDIIFSFFIEHDVYDMIEIDIALEEHGLPCFIE